MEPMEVLHEILAADKKARGSVSAAPQRDEDVDLQLEQLRRRLLNEAMGKAQKQVDMARADALKQAEASLDELKQQHDAELAAMQSRFSERREDAAEQMFRIVVGLDD